MSFLQELKQKLEKGVETAGQKSQKMIEISRLTLRIKGKKEDIERQIQKLGWEVYTHWENTEELTLNESIHLSLQGIRSQREQLVELQKELEEVKKADVIPRKQVEKVNLMIAEAEEDAQPNKEAILLEPVSPVDVAANNPHIPAVIYICPFCAHQVSADAISCTHCEKRFY
ncbi:MAG: hypothetical protein WBZ33_12550 [Thermoactinomyces sp.]